MLVEHLHVLRAHTGGTTHWEHRGLSLLRPILHFPGIPSWRLVKPHLWGSQVKSETLAALPSPRAFPFWLEHGASPLNFPVHFPPLSQVAIYYFQSTRD